MDQQTLRAAGRDLALLRRLSNPNVPQTETFSNVVLLRRLFIEGAIHKYWGALRYETDAKFLIEFTTIRPKFIPCGAKEYLFVLTGDRWSDLLVGGGLGEGEAPKQDDFQAAMEQVHGGMTLGPLDGLFSRSIVLAHRDFKFTPKELIEYQAYTVGDVHLPSAKKPVQKVEAYERLLDRHGELFSFWSSSNGPASLALKGVLNRVVRSDAFRAMFERLEYDGYLPDDVEFPGIGPDTLQNSLFESQCNFGTISLKWTRRAHLRGLPARFESFLSS